MDVHETQAQAEFQEATRHEERTAKLTKETASAEAAWEEIQEQIRATTYSEYVTYCHEELFNNFHVRQDQDLTTTDTTNPSTQQFYPIQLRSWRNFIDEQQNIQEKLSDIFDSPKRFFKSKNDLRVLGGRMAGRPVASDKGLKYILDAFLEYPIRIIYHHLKDLCVDCPFDIEGDVVFENNPNAMSDISDWVCERRLENQTQQPENLSSPPSAALGNLKAEQVCVYKLSADKSSRKRKIAYTIQYKAPHKLTIHQLRAGLSPMDIDVDIDVMNEAGTPQFENRAEEFKYHARKLVTATIAQTFHYMIETGLEYSYLTTGEAIVFLHIDWKNPGTLYYHLAEPVADLSMNPDQPALSAVVSQVLAFTLLAFEAKQHHGQDERKEAQEKLRKWEQDPDEVLRQIPPSVRRMVPDGTAKGYRRRKLHHASPQTQPRSDVHMHEKSHSHESSDSGNSNAQGSSPRQYCTQSCLLGLIDRGPLDPRCPNVKLHQSHKGDDSLHHPIDLKTWRELLKEQLRQTLDDGVVCLDRQGSRGVIFQITLLQHGHTFVGKGTIREFVSDLRHECAMYRYLWPLQGASVPVFLGDIDFQDISRTYYHDFRVYITYMMFISWGGERVEDAGASVGKDPNREVVRSVQALHDMGIAHADVRRPNMLWNDETRRIMVIDFERAILADKQPRSPSRSPSLSAGNKRRRRITQEAVSPGLASNPYGEHHPLTAMQQDLELARDLFKP
ncbi:hypothetical protein M426DRAFT_317363 [Hypoxylon sp. CI-4A]|nr:hypothetical protein M426DRAFT_317363 [Hypoxylon sp. CI-4A]